jgi:hypothetical protein
MTQRINRPRYSKEEFARRGHELYQESVAPKITAEDLNKFVAIDIESGIYEIDPDDYRATERLRQRCPQAQIWLQRIGHPTAYRLGWAPKAIR